jgi:hypothetical protein
MAEGRGGYRKPNSPAPVSGPGQLSRRTDGGPQQTTQPMTGMGYGENAEFTEMQSSRSAGGGTVGVQYESAESTSHRSGCCRRSPLFTYWFP